MKKILVLASLLSISACKEQKTSDTNLLATKWFSIKDEETALDISSCEFSEKERVCTINTTVKPEKPEDKVSANYEITFTEDYKGSNFGLMKVKATLTDNDTDMTIEYSGGYKVSKGILRICATQLSKHHCAQYR